MKSAVVIPLTLADAILIATLMVRHHTVYGTRNKSSILSFYFHEQDHIVALIRCQITSGALVAKITVHGEVTKPL